jgi:hypothetical protein
VSSVLDLIRQRRERARRAERIPEVLCAAGAALLLGGGDPVAEAALEQRHGRGLGGHYVRYLRRGGREKKRGRPGRGEMSRAALLLPALRPTVGTLRERAAVAHRTKGLFFIVGMSRADARASATRVCNKNCNEEPVPAAGRPVLQCAPCMGW